MLMGGKLSHDPVSLNSLRSLPYFLGH